MFETVRSVYKYKEGIYDLLDESNINIVSGCESYSNKKQKLQIWKELKKQYGDNLQIIFGDKTINYTCKVNWNLYI